MSAYDQCESQTDDFPMKSTESLPIKEKRRRLYKKSSFHADFNSLKAKLNITENLRKTQVDSLLKKCKSKAFKSIHEAIKRCIDFKIDRLPQKFITNVKIDYNKKYLSYTIRQIYSEFNILNNIDEKIESNFIKKEKTNIFITFLHFTYQELYQNYINSKQFIRDCEQIKEREGERFYWLFRTMANVYIDYYTESKGNKLKMDNLKAYRKGYSNSKETEPESGFSSKLLIIHNQPRVRCQHSKNAQNANNECFYNSCSAITDGNI